ncbi:disintegrin and metalloproteinase domain-containing protein 10-like [Varroa destructor]|uniref:ADAM10 endopeptidase n=1 Tax=Varroa destructor TaxID=109461 RepID=A0A7M7JGJ7_VARDE|nr:disintegrin and metalloproteinase domain-containing protein 10-like [Varroa destructor]
MCSPLKLHRKRLRGELVVLCLIWFLGVAGQPRLCLARSDVETLQNSGTTAGNNQRRLNHFVRHYEPVVYDDKDLHARHERVRRSADDPSNTNKPSVLHLRFRSHNRVFHLRLKRDTSVFSDGLQVEDHEGRRLQVDTDHLYSGEIVGERDSHVFGSIHDGIFQGRIESTQDKEHYYVERASYHRRPGSLALDGRINGHEKMAHTRATEGSETADNSDQIELGPHYHSIMYAGSNVEILGHQEGQGSCGATDDATRKWMERVANSAVESMQSTTRLEHEKETTKEQPKDTKYGHAQDKSQRRKRHEPQLERREHFEEMKIEDDEDFSRTIWQEEKWKIRRSAARTSHGGLTQHAHLYSDNPLKYNRAPHSTLASNANRRVCNLFVQTDTFLWEHIISTGKDNAKAREEISSLIAQHVEAASRIYKNTDFNGIKDIKFAVQRIRINDTSACQGPSRFTNPFCAANLDASNFLNLNSLANHDDFCLAYVWTFRDFQHGTLGLAWVASVNGASGGICEKYKTYSENNNGRSENVRRSLNTGIITFLNHNAKIPLKVSEITFAHEIGHNFGSPHDFPPRCVPGGNNGNYIMYASATQGHQPNNQKFSDCSIANISNVLHAIFKGEQKENCFQEYQGPFCGNKIVELNEECDCGYDERECDESCCFARDNSERQKGCTRRSFAHCSPSEGPCCNLRCEFETSGKPCRLETDCTEVSYCRGSAPHCPAPVHKPNKTECNNGTQVCWNGECSGSICNKYGLEECFLTEDKTPDPDKLCEVACQQWNKPETCRSTFEIEAMRHISGIKRRPGSPCNNFHGYCDVFQKCRNVDAEGPLARLKRLLFNKQSLHSVRQWVTLNWWAVLLMMVSLIITMACFIRCCAVHTPSSNPRMPPALRITDTLRRPGDTFKRRKRYVPPVEQNGPPPPYPGVGGAVVAPSAPPGPSQGPSMAATPAATSGPSHGYGQGRGHYNRSQQGGHPPGGQRGPQSGKAGKKNSKGSIEMQSQQQQQLSHHVNNATRNQRV